MKNEAKKFKVMSYTLAALMVIMIVSVIPLAKNLGTLGFALWGIIAAASIGYSIRVELFKKAHGLHTYKEISEFMECGKILENPTEISPERKFWETLCKILWGIGITLIILVFIR